VCQKILKLMRRERILLAGWGGTLFRGGGGGGGDYLQKTTSCRADYSQLENGFSFLSRGNLPKVKMTDDGKAPSKKKASCLLLL